MSAEARRGFVQIFLSPDADGDVRSFFGKFLGGRSAQPFARGGYERQFALESEVAVCSLAEGLGQTANNVTEIRQDSAAVIDRLDGSRNGIG